MLAASRSLAEFLFIGEWIVIGCSYQQSIRGHKYSLGHNVGLLNLHISFGNTDVGYCFVYQRKGKIREERRGEERREEREFES